MAEFASRGVGAAGLTTGIIGSTLGAINSGLFGGLLGNGAVCHENMPINRYEASLESKISEKDMEIAYLKGQNATDVKILDLYKYVNGELNAIKKEQADQRVFNATSIATVNCISGQVAQLMSLTKCVIPNSSICPGWGDVTVTPAAAPTTAG